MRSFFLSTSFVVLAAGYAAAQAIPLGPPPKMAPDTGLHAILLGTGMPLPNPERAAAATLIVAGGKTFMVDTGFNSVPRLGEAGYQDVDYVLFTHFHIDHYGDFDRLLFQRGGAGAAAEPLQVLGPKGSKAIVDKIVASVAIDEHYRIEHHGEHWSPNAMQAETTECEPGVILEEDGVTITMFLVDHEPIEVAVGYRFDYEGKSIVVSGDTKRSASLIAASTDCDILIHEAMDERMLNAVRPMLARQNPRGAQMVADLMEVHTSTLDCAEIAKQANAKKLVLTHLVPSIPPQEGPEKNFIRGMAEIYSGPILVGRDLMMISATDE